ncbi:MAG: prepilin-type cleavage/methylation domain-containing protein [Gammaproteobacteria bacterium]|nr:MAG: prepilin-type cleavage/methylation domain-containing protein [Gammaproteobacteria bacterium]
MCGLVPVVMVNAGLDQLVERRRMDILKKEQAGFTLVEIAIVLVIIGLLIGGILKVQGMITNTKLKRVESDNAGLISALYSYQDRYLQLPGDDSTASDRFTVYAGATLNNGDGDGLIGDGTDWRSNTAWAVAGDSETTKFFGHLRAAGLITGSAFDRNRPINAFGGEIGIQQGSLEMIGQVVILGSIDGSIARILDRRLDDGVLNTGRTRSALASGGTAMDANTTPAAIEYIDTGIFHMAFRLLSR